MATKIKILEEQFDRALYRILSDDNVLTEGSVSVTKNDVEEIAKRAIKNYLENSRSPELEKKVKSMMKDILKNNSDFDNAVVEITRNVLVQLYKSLWAKRSFWSGDLRNVSS